MNKYPLRLINKNLFEKYNMDSFPSMHRRFPLREIRKYFGRKAMLVRCGSYIYNVSKNPEIYRDGK